MKILKEFSLREIAGEYVLIPVGSTVSEFKGLITVNSTAAFLWSNMEKANSERELVNMLLEEFDVDEKQAQEDVCCLCSELRAAGFIE